MLQLHCKPQDTTEEATLYHTSPCTYQDQCCLLHYWQWPSSISGSGFSKSSLEVSDINPGTFKPGRLSTTRLFPLFICSSLLIRFWRDISNKLGICKNKPKTHARWWMKRSLANLRGCTQRCTPYQSIPSPQDPFSSDSHSLKGPIVRQSGLGRVHSLQNQFSLLNPDPGLKQPNI